MVDEGREGVAITMVWADNIAIAAMNQEWARRWERMTKAVAVDARVKIEDPGIVVEAGGMIFIGAEWRCDKGPKVVWRHVTKNAEAWHEMENQEILIRQPYWRWQKWQKFYIGIGSYQA